MNNEYRSTCPQLRSGRQANDDLRSMETLCTCNKSEIRNQKSLFLNQIDEQK
jgi:hypothetical protein